MRATSGSSPIRPDQKITLDSELKARYKESDMNTVIQTEATDSSNLTRELALSVLMKTSLQISEVDETAYERTFRSELEAQYFAVCAEYLGAEIIERAKNLGRGKRYRTTFVPTHNMVLVLSAR